LQQEHVISDVKPLLGCAMAGTVLVLLLWALIAATAAILLSAAAALFSLSIASALLSSCWTRTEYQKRKN